jgi:hypothetical protein
MGLHGLLQGIALPLYILRVLIINDRRWQNTILSKSKNTAQRIISGIVLIMYLDYKFTKVCFINNLLSNYYINKPKVPCLFLLFDICTCFIEQKTLIRGEIVDNATHSFINGS